PAPRVASITVVAPPRKRSTSSTMTGSWPRSASTPPSSQQVGREQPEPQERGRRYGGHHDQRQALAKLASQRFLAHGSSLIPWPSSLGSRCERSRLVGAGVGRLVPLMGDPVPDLHPVRDAEHDGLLADPGLVAQAL